MKTFKELKDIIEDYIDFEDVCYEGGSAIYNEAWKELEEAYEKQIAKPHIAGRCHACDSNVLIYQGISYPYCPWCGQAVGFNDWSEEE